MHSKRLELLLCALLCFCALAAGNSGVSENQSQQIQTATNPVMLPGTRIDPKQSVRDRLETMPTDSLSNTKREQHPGLKFISVSPTTGGHLPGDKVPFGLLLALMSRFRRFRYLSNHSRTEVSWLSNRTEAPVEPRQTNGAVTGGSEQLSSRMAQLTNCGKSVFFWLLHMVEEHRPIAVVISCILWMFIMTLAVTYMIKINKARKKGSLAEKSPYLPCPRRWNGVKKLHGKPRKDDLDSECTPLWFGKS